MVEINRLPTDHRLDKIGVCLACGNPNRPDNELTRDHYFPKDLLNIPRGLREKHPF